MKVYTVKMGNKQKSAKKNRLKKKLIEATNFMTSTITIFI